MPNHVHVLASLHAPHALSETVKSWKGISSRLIHKAQLSDLEPFWQPDYYDRLIRSWEHFNYVQSYIRQNPKDAALKVGSYLYWEKANADKLL